MVLLTLPVKLAWQPDAAHGADQPLPEFWNQPRMVRGCVPLAAEMEPTMSTGTLMVVCVADNAAQEPPVMLVAACTVASAPLVFSDDRQPDVNTPSGLDSRFNGE